MKKITYIIWLISVLGMYSHHGYAQKMIRANPADVNDPQALFINPAIIPYRNLTFNLGMKIYHFGFLDNNSAGLKYSYSSNSFPNLLFNNIGVGVTLESFNTPYFNTSGIGASFAYSVMPSFSIGLSAHGNNLNYSDLDLDDPFDPVFLNGTGQWNVSFDAGLLIRPTENFSVALSCNNLNRPDLSLVNQDARVPLELNFGIKHYFKIFGASIFGHFQDEDLAVGIIGEAKLSNRGIIKAGYAERCFLFEGQLNVGSGFAVNYRMDYPLNEVNIFSSGSHQLGVTWNMRLNPDYAFNIQASVDTVKVIREVSKIKINKNEDRSQIFKQLDDLDLYFPDSGQKDNANIQIENSGMSLDDIFNQSVPHNNYLENYRKNFQEMRDIINSANKKINVDIYFPDATTAERALIIKNFLVDSLSFKQDEIKLHKESNSNHNNHSAKKDSIKNLIDSSNTKLNASEFIEISSPPRERMEPNKICFKINATSLTKVSKWRILITNFLGEPVYEIPGERNVEQEILWDGFKDDGKLMNVGNYYYQFQYKMNDNRWIPMKPKRYPIVFVQIKRSKVIEITTNQVNDLQMLKEIVIRLKTPPPEVEDSGN